MKRAGNGTRNFVYYRDSGCCVYCLRAADTVDHIKPLSAGGRSRARNLVACCWDCNHYKADHTLEEFLRLFRRYLGQYNGGTVEGIAARVQTQVQTTTVTFVIRKGAEENVRTVVSTSMAEHSTTMGANKNNHP